MRKASIQKGTKGSRFRLEIFSMFQTVPVPNAGRARRIRKTRVPCQIVVANMYIDKQVKQLFVSQVLQILFAT